MRLQNYKGQIRFEGDTWMDVKDAINEAMGQIVSGHTSGNNYVNAECGAYVFAMDPHMPPTEGWD